MNRSSSLTPTEPVLRKALHWLLFAALISPLLYYWVYSIWLNPSANYYTNDAEFPHYMNSLAPFKGGRYGYIDHPGTPVQMLGTVILGVMYAFTKDAPHGFVYQYLEEPGRFLDVATSTLMFLYLFTTCVFFWVARSEKGWKDSLYAVGLAVLYYAIHPLSLSASTVWNHNSFNFPLGTLILLCLYKYVVKAQKEIPISTWVIGGLCAGIFTAVTIYMAGWIVGVVTVAFLYSLLHKDRWYKVIITTGLTGLSAVGGFVVAVLPIFERMTYFRNWIMSLLTHESRYLDVPEDQPRLERLVSNFIEFYKILPTLFIFFVLLAVFSLILFVLFRRKLTENPGHWALIIGLAAQSSAILLMFLDRPLQSSYFLSIAAILPVWALTLYDLLKPHARTVAILGIAFVLVGLIGMTVTAVKSVDVKRAEVDTFHASEAMIDSAIQRRADETGRSPDDIVVMWMYGSYSPCWGLRLGDSRSFDIFTDEIEDICPNQYLLSNGLRVSKFGNNSRLEEEPWDIVFGCQTNLKKLRELQLTLKVEEHPELTWMCGVPVVVTHE